jgi:hypothetical protein
LPGFKLCRQPPLHRTFVALLWERAGIGRRVIQTVLCRVSRELDALLLREKGEQGIEKTWGMRVS